MAPGTVLRSLRQKKLYNKYVTFLVVSGSLYAGYMLATLLDVVAVLPLPSDENGTAWPSSFAELDEEAASPTPGEVNANGSSANALLGTAILSPTPGGAPSIGSVNSTVDALENKWLITLDEPLGRIGNQMFEYASLLGIGWMTGRRAFVQLSPYFKQIFQLTQVELIHSKGNWSVVEETQYAYFDPVFRKLPDGNVKVSGYLQSWKYFDRIRSHIRKEFTLHQNIRSEVDKLKDEISQTLNKTDPVFVAVHVRQTDEKSTPNTVEAPRSYFLNAFSKMRSLLAGYDLIFLVAGNKLDWCRANLNDSDVHVLPEMLPEEHFAALSSCEHAIISVGSYGWWVAWLTGGQVMFYKKFPAPGTHEYKGFVHGDYYPPHWLPVDD